jgi:hypothetical protein
MNIRRTPNLLTPVRRRRAPGERGQSRSRSCVVGRRSGRAFDPMTPRPQRPHNPRARALRARALRARAFAPAPYAPARESPAAGISGVTPRVEGYISARARGRISSVRIPAEPQTAADCAVQTPRLPAQSRAVCPRAGAELPTSRALGHAETRELTSTHQGSTGWSPPRRSARSSRRRVP